MGHLVHPNHTEMEINDPREQARQALRTRIVEAARDIVSEAGLDALSMRALAERINYSPATLYLHFRDKDEILRGVVEAGFERLTAAVEAQIARLDENAPAGERHRALGRGYAIFALENTGYFRVMFELPTVARVGRDAKCAPEGRQEAGGSWCQLVETVQQAIAEGTLRIADAHHGAVISWGLVHGLTSLYLGGHLSAILTSSEEFLRMLEESMDVLSHGWGKETTAAAAP